MVGTIPKSPGIGPDCALPGCNWSQNGSRTLPLKDATSASVSQGRSTRHGEYKRYSGLMREVLWKDGEFRPTNGKTYILGLGTNQDTYRRPSISLICPGATSVSSFSHGP
jgi:hypothetical protein